MSLSFNPNGRLPHLTRGAGGVSGEVGLLRRDVAAAFDEVEAMGIHLMRFDAPSTALVDADGIKTTVASVAAPTTYTGADFNGALAPGSGDAIINSPKRVTVTVAGTGTPADWTGGTITVIGTDVYGDPLEEDVTSAAGAGTTTTVGYFATVSQVELPAAAGTGASLTIGVAADAAPLLTFASATTEQILDGTDESIWNMARVGNRRQAIARRLTFVFSAHANWDATTGVVRGRDIRGNQISENISIPNGGGTVSTAKFYASIERITIPVQSGGSGTCDVAFVENELGLDMDAISAVEAVCVIREASRADDSAAYAVPTAGAVDPASVTNCAPYGRYTPHSSVVVDGLRDYVLAYIPAAA